MGKNGREITGFKAGYREANIDCGEAILVDVNRPPDDRNRVGLFATGAWDLAQDAKDDTGHPL